MAVRAERGLAGVLHHDRLHDLLDCDRGRVTANVDDAGEVLVETNFVAPVDPEPAPLAEDAILGAERRCACRR